MSITFQQAYGLPEGDKLAVTKGVESHPEWIKLGCADADEYLCEEKGATFKYSDKELPNLDEHNNFVVDELKKNPNLWEELKDKITSTGVTLAHCLKTGIDNKGHPMIKTVGLVAGDEESFTLFKDIFDPVISARHNGYGPDAKHVSDMDPSHLHDTQMDPEGKYCLTTRCRTGRSIKGTRLPPTCSFAERRQIEMDCVKGLMALTGELKGTYLPLHGNKSNVLKELGHDEEGKYENGMSEEQEEDLRSRGNLFQEPDSTLLLSSGCGRHWPDARGIFHNEEKNFFTWVNEEDQMRIISMQKGDGVREIFTRFANATKTIEETLKEQGKSFMYNDHLGYVLTCPSNLGTGLRAGTMIKCPLFSARPDFKKILGNMGLQARGTAGVDSASTGGTWDISNADRLGKSEVRLVNLFIEGLTQIIEWEKALEAGSNIDDQFVDADPVEYKKKEKVAPLFQSEV